MLKGQIEADTENEARGEMINQGYKVLKITAARSLPSLEDLFPSIFKVGAGELVRFSRQFSTMVRGGSNLQLISRRFSLLPVCARLWFH